MGFQADALIVRRTGNNKTVFSDSNRKTRTHGNRLAAFRFGIRGWSSLLLIFILLATLASIVLFRGKGFFEYWMARVSGGYRIEERIAQFSSAVEARLRPEFEVVNLPYPLFEVAYIAIKDARQLEVYARKSSTDDWRHIKDYPILGLSGHSGPKCLEGDRQVPEGIYRAEYLNPNSRFHVSIRLNYPNDFDRNQAEADGRKNLGSDIMIHGGSSSIGCLAIGDIAAEELFTLAALVTKERVRIIISPTDFRIRSMEVGNNQPSWVEDLYEDLRDELVQFKR